MVYSNNVDEYYLAYEGTTDTGETIFRAYGGWFDMYI